MSADAIFSRICPRAAEPDISREFARAREAGWRGALRCCDDGRKHFIGGVESSVRSSRLLYSLISPPGAGAAGGAMAERPLSSFFDDWDEEDESETFEDATAGPDGGGAAGGDAGDGDAEATSIEATTRAVASATIDDADDDDDADDGEEDDEWGDAEWNGADDDEDVAGDASGDGDGDDRDADAISADGSCDGVMIANDGPPRPREDAPRTCDDPSPSTSRLSYCRECGGKGRCGCEACARTGVENNWLFRPARKGGWGARGSWRDPANPPPPPPPP